MDRRFTLRRAAVLVLGTVALAGAGAGTASADTAVRVRLPTGVHAQSIYVYRGGGPAGASDWDGCFAAGGQVRVPATPGQGQWNFYAYPDPGCPIDRAPIEKATNVTAPGNLSDWSVTLH